MRYLIIAIAIVLMFTGVALAEETGRGDYTTPIPPLTDWLNDNPDFYHSHSYMDRYNEEAEEYKDPLGIGINAKVWDFKKQDMSVLDSIGIEGKYDINNSEFSCFAVLAIDLTELYQ